jgi:hypothetical protein
MEKGTPPMAQANDDDGKRSQERNVSRILAVLAAVAAVAVLAASFIQDTPSKLPDIALGWPLILFIERAGLTAFLVMGLGGLGYRLWRGDQVKQAGTQQVAVEEATRPAEVLKEGVDESIRQLSERVTEIERKTERMQGDEA